MAEKMVCKCESENVMDSKERYAFRREGGGAFDGAKPLFGHAQYIAIGDVLKKFPDIDIFNEFIRMLEEDNPKFDRDRFIGYVEGKVKR